MIIGHGGRPRGDTSGVLVFVVLRTVPACVVKNEVTTIDERHSNSLFIRVARSKTPLIGRIIAEIQDIVGRA